jgi:hypothetical protein
VAEAPYRAGAGGPIQIEIDLGGKMKRTRYHLDADVLRIEPLDGAVPPEQVALAEVTRVELATLAGTTICTLHLGDNRKASVSSGMNDKPDPAAARAFATLLEALNERIAVANPSATFTSGSWWLGGGLLIITLIGGAALAWLALDPVRRTFLKFKIGCVMFAAMLLVAVPLAFVRGRPKPYDPRKIPRRYDPLPPE